jgi:hypothetical protein
VKALRIFMVMALAAVAMGLFACGHGDNGGSSGGDNVTDYSQYSGVFLGSYAITDSSDGIGIGGAGTWTVQLQVTPYGYATVLHTDPNCGDVLSTGIFYGNTLVIRSGERWQCGWATCCDGFTTTAIRFTDRNNGTLTRTSNSCCSTQWQKGSGKFTRQ